MVPKHDGRVIRGKQKTSAACVGNGTVSPHRLPRPDDSRPKNAVFDSLTKRQARAWDNNRWTLAEYLEYRYKQEFGQKCRPRKPAFVPPVPQRSQNPSAGRTGAPLAQHNPFYERKATAMRQWREHAGLSILCWSSTTNIHPDTIRALEDPDSRKAVSFETVGQIATVLGLELRVDFRLERPRATVEQGLEGNEAEQAVKASGSLGRSVQEAKLALRLPLSIGEGSARGAA